MTLFPSLPSITHPDPGSVRSRMAALPGLSSSSADRDAVDAAVDEPTLGSPRRTGPAAGHPARAMPLASSLLQRWVPASLRDARWEPGRPGALTLSLVAALAAVVAAVGVWWERPVPEPVPVLPPVTVAAAKSSPALPPGPVHEVVISVVGRVTRPGLIHLPEGARVADALAAVGGALPGTDLISLNLAQRVSDGEQLLVGVAPPPGQLIGSPGPGTNGAGPGAARPGAHGAGPTGAPQVVDLNSATLEQLDGLPGVGTVMAQRVLAWRQAHGRFTSVDQLREVSGFGPARLAQLRHRVRV